MDSPVKVPSRKLGKTGLDVPELGLGTWGLCAESYGRVFPEQRERTLSRALDQGITLFDMAPTWGEDGLSERAVAAAVGTRRAEVVYVTRAGRRSTEVGPEACFDGASLRAQCESSLERLGTDHIDVWLLHEPSEEDLRREDVRRVTDELVAEGKVRVTGASVSTRDAARAALEAGAQVLCLPYNILWQELFEDVASQAAALGVGILARSVLAHGLLAGRWTAKKRFMPDDHRAQRWSSDALGARVAQVNELRSLVHGPTLSLASAAERFVLANPLVSCALMGPRTPGQVEACVHALTGLPYMEPGDLSRIKKASR